MKKKKAAPEEKRIFLMVEVLDESAFWIWDSFLKAIPYNGVIVRNIIHDLNPLKKRQGTPNKIKVRKNDEK